MSTKHTPGPLDWMAVSANASGGFHAYMVDANGRKIAALWGKAKEKEANARLWGAAPELLDLAQQFEKTAEYYLRIAEKEDPDSAPGIRLTLNLIRATIAKATGGRP
jgi:hypothetical protein